MLQRNTVLISSQTGINHEYHVLKFQSVRREIEYGNRLASLAIAWVVFDLETTTINTMNQADCREVLIDVLNYLPPSGSWHAASTFIDIRVCTAQKLCCVVTVECHSCNKPLNIALSYDSSDVQNFISLMDFPCQRQHLHETRYSLSVRSHYVMLQSRFFCNIKMKAIHNLLPRVKVLNTYLRTNYYIFRLVFLCLRKITTYFLVSVLTSSVPFYTKHVNGFSFSTVSQC